MSMTIKNFIGGEWKSVKGRGEFDSVNPANTSEVLATVPRSGREDVDLAVAAARESFLLWRSMPAPRPCCWVLP